MTDRIETLNAALSVDRASCGALSKWDREWALRESNNSRKKAQKAENEEEKSRAKAQR